MMAGGAVSAGAPPLNGTDTMSVSVNLEHFRGVRTRAAGRGERDVQ